MQKTKDMKNKILQISTVFRYRTEATVNEVRQIRVNMAHMAKDAIKYALTHAKKLVSESA